MRVITIFVIIVFLAFVNSLDKQALGIPPHVPSASAKTYFLIFPNTYHVPSPRLASHMLFALPEVLFTPHLPGKLTLQASANSFSP